MVSVNVINSILSVIDRFVFDKKSISSLSKINLMETENALKVLISHGYVLKSNSKGINKGKKYKYTCYTASEAAKEILKNGGFTKQLSMKEKSKTSVKNKLSIKDSNISGHINQGSLLELSPININTNDIPSKNPVIKSRLNTILSNPWVIGIAFALLAAILNGKTVMNFINDIF